MKKIIIIFSVTVFHFQVTAQVIPPFQPRDFSLAVPAFLPGINNDSSVLTLNDTLIYNLNGRLFERGFKINPGRKTARLSNPLEVLRQLVDAYAKKDKVRIINLYNDSSAKQARELIDGPKGGGFLSYVQSVAIPGVELLAMIAYRNGYVAFVKDNKKRVELNYIVKEGNIYKLSAFNENKAMIWNLLVYFSTTPQPMVALKNVAIKDSLSINDSVIVHITVPAGVPYVTLFTNTPGEAPQLIIQDNEDRDLDRVKNKVSFYVPGFLFKRTGRHTFYFAAFNYPVSFVSANFLVREAQHCINILE